jgi:hypothetical protein
MIDKNAESPAQDAGKDGAEGVQLSCKVLQAGLKIGNFKKARGKIIRLAETTALALQKAAAVQITGD